MVSVITVAVVGFSLGWLCCEVFGCLERRKQERRKVWRPSNIRRKGLL